MTEENELPAWTDEELRAFAAERLAGDPGGPIPSWPSAAAREIAEREAAGIEVPSEAAAR